jgi:hypothetical protein
MVESEILLQKRIILQENHRFIESVAGVPTQYC